MTMMMIIMNKLSASFWDKPQAPQGRKLCSLLPMATSLCASHQLGEHTHTYTNTHIMHMHTCIIMHAHMHTHMHTHIHTHTHMHAHIHYTYA